MHITGARGPDEVHAHLEALYAGTDHATRLATDPLAFAHRYGAPEDIEIAGLLAASLAFGRVDLFRPVLAQLFDIMDSGGGPRAFVEHLTPSSAAPLRPLVYRWIRGPHLILLMAALRRAAGGGSLEGLFVGPDTRARLAAAVTTLREAARVEASAWGVDPELPRGVRFLLPSPDSGSACKRWNLYLRWMVRSDREGLDFGLWQTWSTADLVIPLDVHVARISRFLGLTSRADASWKTAVHITDALRRFDPVDPLRFDFAISHLGISDACLGYRDPMVCPPCPLEGVCQAS